MAGTLGLPKKDVPLETATEVRMRCLEAAAKNPLPHKDGFAAGVLETAQVFANWVLGK